MERDMQWAIELAEDPRNFGSVTTLFRDGSPQTTPVWIDGAEGRLAFNTRMSRAKFANLSRDPRIALAIVNSANPYQYVEIRGRAEMTYQGADEHVHALSVKYTGEPYKGPIDDRVIVKIIPQRSSSRSG